MHHKVFCLGYKTPCGAFLVSKKFYTNKMID